MNKSINKNIINLLSGLVLFFVGYFLYSKSLGYTYHSLEHVSILMIAKIWAAAFLIVSICFLYLKRKSENIAVYTIFSVSIYFVVLYGILFITTEYGMHGHWGDNGNRLAYITKMMAYNTFITDWYYKDLPGFYPPMWFYLMSLYGKMLGLEAYQTTKFGYLLTYLVYPWLIYFSWRKILSKTAAAAIAIGTIFFAFKYLDWINYEHITAALIIPWWLYYFENYSNRAIEKKNWKFYLWGGLIGGLLAMTYYYWFFIIIFAQPLIIVKSYFEKKSFGRIIDEFKHKFIIASVIGLVTVFYWLPLFRSIFKYGVESSQNVWFGMHHANLTFVWTDFSLEIFLIIVGIFFLFYLWKVEKFGLFLVWFTACLMLIIVDRFYNVFGSSLQSRKIIEFVHVFAMVPLVVGLTIKLKEYKFTQNIKNGLFGLLVLGLLVTSNAHTEIKPINFYKNAVNQRVPQKDLDVFKTVETYDKVFLSTHYLEACYLPYYMFITYNNMSSHTAGQYSQREIFLDEVSTIKEPELLAYVLQYNHYDKVDYIYLPFDKKFEKYQMLLYQISFNDTKGKVKKINFECRYDLPNEYFELKHEWGLFEILPINKSDVLEDRIKSIYPSLKLHI